MTTYNVQSSNPGLSVGTKTVLNGGAVVKVGHTHIHTLFSNDAQFLGSYHLIEEI